MKTKKAQKRLNLSTETLRTLRTDEVQNVAGGANDEVAFLDSVSISWGGHNCCNCK